MHPCAICHTPIPDPPATFPRTPAVLYCSPECLREGRLARQKTSYRKHRVRRIADSRGWQLAHPERARATRVAGDQVHRDRIRTATRHSRAKLYFGLSPNDLAQMEADQGGLCAICRRPECRTRRDGTVKSLSMDHDHESGDMRGLLCEDCNHALGWLERINRNVEWRDAALEYLRSSQGREKEAV